MAALLLAGWSISTAVAAGGDAKSGSDSNGDAAAFVRMPQISVTYFADDVPRGVMSAIVLLEVSGEEEREHLLANLPRLKDAYIQALYRLAEAEQRLQAEYGPLEIKRALQLVSDSVLGAGVVDEVLVEGVTRTGAN